MPNIYIKPPNEPTGLSSIKGSSPIKPAPPYHIWGLPQEPVFGKPTIGQVKNVPVIVNLHTLNKKCNCPKKTSEVVSPVKKKKSFLAVLGVIGLALAGSK